MNTEQMLEMIKDIIAAEHGNAPDLSLDGWLTEIEGMTQDAIELADDGFPGEAEQKLLEVAVKVILALTQHNSSLH